MEQAPAMTAKVPIPKSRSGRPSAARATAIDRAIIEAARTRFLADGFDAVAMEQIAAMADISKGTLYARYASKETLFTAVIEASVRQWSEEASQLDHLLTGEIEQRLRYHARTIARSLQRADVRDMQRLILSVRGRFPAFATAMHDIGYRYIVDLITRDIEDAAAKDASPARDPGAVARALVAGLTGFQLQEVGFSECGDDIDRFGQRLVDLIMAGRSAW